MPCPHCPRNGATVSDFDPFVERWVVDPGRVRFLHRVDAVIAAYFKRPTPSTPNSTPTNRGRSGELGSPTLVSVESSVVQTAGPSAPLTAQGLA